MWLKCFTSIYGKYQYSFKCNFFYAPMNSLHLEKSMETGLYVKLYTPKG